MLYRVEYLTKQLNELYRRSSETLASLRSLKYTIRQLNYASKKTDGYLQVIHRYMYQQGREMNFDDLSTPENEKEQSHNLFQNQGTCECRFEHSKYPTKYDSDDIGECYWDHFDGEMDPTFESYTFHVKPQRKRGRKMSCTSELSSAFPFSEENEETSPADCIEHSDVYQCSSNRNLNQDVFNKVKKSGRRLSAPLAFLNLRSKSSLDQKMGRKVHRQSTTRSSKRSSSSLNPKGSTPYQPPNIHIIPNSPIPEDTGLETLQINNQTIAHDVGRASTFPCRRRLSVPNGFQSSVTNECFQESSWISKRRSADHCKANSDTERVLFPEDIQGISDNQELPETPRTPEPMTFIHDYSSITDEIETNELFNIHGSIINKALLNSPEVYNLALMRRQGLCGSTRSLTETEQAIIAKEEHLLDAEKQVYKQMEKECDSVMQESTKTYDQLHELKDGAPKPLDLTRSNSGYSESTCSCRSRRSHHVKEPEDDIEGPQLDRTLDSNDSLVVEVDIDKTK